MRYLEVAFRGMRGIERRAEGPVEYLHEPSKVIHLNTPHARANARQAAVSLEEDREAVRRQEIVAQLEELYADRDRINCRIFDLENEQQRLRGGSRG